MLSYLRNFFAETALLRLVAPANALSCVCDNSQQHILTLSRLQAKFVNLLKFEFIYVNKVSPHIVCWSTMCGQVRSRDSQAEWSETSVPTMTSMYDNDGRRTQTQQNRKNPFANGRTWGGAFALFQTDIQAQYIIRSDPHSLNRRNCKFIEIISDTRVSSGAHLTVRRNPVIWIRRKASGPGRKPNPHPFTMNPCIFYEYNTHNESVHIYENNRSPPARCR